MAEKFPYNIAGKLLMKLSSPALQETKLLWGSGTEAELEKLKAILSAIQPVLLDAEQKQATNSPVREWLKNLKVALYEADDLLNDFTRVSTPKVVSQNKVTWAHALGWRKVVLSVPLISLISLSRYQIAFRLKMGHKVKVIGEKFNSIAENRKKFHLTERQEEMRVENLPRETHSYVCVEEIFGREKDKDAIIELLLNSNVQDDVSIIPIVGIGGIGKTTVAQLVYNDEKVQKNFELIMWVCISDVFNVKLIAQNVIESATCNKSKGVQLEVVKDDLKRQIDGKKYFLVLDDVWNEDHNLWLKLRDLLRGGARGSKILVTTRTQLVAEIMGTVSPYPLGGLSESESWSLFKQRALKPEVKPGNPRVAIGKDIVKKCVGVPLAIRTVGALLYTKDTEREWLYFKDKELSEIDQTENGIFSILKLSYDYLPPHLKRCFAYCSLFLKDHIIDKQTLIQLWMAHGFIHERQHLEDVGDQYFMELLRRSFFQDVSEDEKGNVICKMHDLIHDLAEFIAGSESYAIDWDVKGFDEKTRHVLATVHIGSDRTIPATFSEANKLRTILLVSHPKFWTSKRVAEHMSWSNGTIASSKCPRVLDLHWLGIERVPSSIGKLTHLRNLDLSHNNFLFLPKCICRLQNLQTLKLNGCKKLKELPKEIKNLVNLRELEIDDCSELRHMPRELGQLTSLQRLSTFVVSHKETTSAATGFRAGLSLLEGLVNLRGSLRIVGLSRGGSTAEETREKRTPANPSYLAGLEFLESLNLRWDPEADIHDESSFENLRPHPKLKNLDMTWYNGVGFPSWMKVDIGLSLPYLVKIVMGGCNGCQHLTLFGLLPSLQVLDLCVMESLEYVDKEEEEDPSSSSSSSKARGLFLSLKMLKLTHLVRLKGIENRGREVVPTAIASSPFGAMPHLSVLEHLYIDYCPQLDLSADDDEGVQFQSLRSLIYLSIKSMPNLVSRTAGLQYLTGLQSLLVEWCSDLVALPESIGNLTSL